MPSSSAAVLEPLPPRFAETRSALHRVAEEVLKPARERVTGRFGLRALPGGFGTPPFGEVTQLHVDGTELVTRCDGELRREPIDGVDPDAATALANWFAFGVGVLEELLADAGSSLSPTPAQLWPEHFDVAIELGDEEAGRRATYGASPGDDEHPEPYLYVATWNPQPDGPLWNATAFTGAELAYTELLEASDRRAAAHDFFRARLDAL
jgi:hypothetical protein